jgi:hypothetical protein
LKVIKAHLWRQARVLLPQVAAGFSGSASLELQGLQFDAFNGLFG